MKTAIFTFTSIMLLSTSINAQTYSTTGGIITISGPGNSGAFYDLDITDEFSVSDVQARVVCHVLDNAGDTLSVLGNLGIELWKNGTGVFLVDHNCTDTVFSRVDLTFSDYANTNINLACSPSGTYKTTTQDHFGDVLNTDLSVFNGTANSVGTWQFLFTWKPVAGGPADNLLSVDSLILIFNTQTLGVDDPASDNPVTIYPNPAQKGEIIFIQNDSPAVCDINVYDLTGKLIFSQADNTGTTEISAAGMETGIYLVEILNEDGSTIYEKISIK